MFDTDKLDKPTKQWMCFFFSLSSLNTSLGQNKYSVFLQEMVPPIKIKLCITKIEFFKILCR